MKTWGFGIIGCGAISDFHIRAIKDIPNARLAAVASRSATKAQQIGEREGCRWATDYGELLASPDVEIVCITTSSGSHYGIAKEALEAGKHVLVEKPIAMRAEEADHLVDLARRKRLTLSVVSQRRFEPQLMHVKRAIDAGKLGRLLLVEASTPFYRTQAYYDSAAWRGTREEDGGALMNQGIHQIDLLLWYGGPVRTVYGKIATFTHQIEAEDTGVAIVHFTSGALGTIMASTSTQPGFPPRIHLFGEKGTVKIEGNQVVFWNVPDAEEPPRETAGKGGGESDPLAFSHVYHKLQIEDFLRAVAEGADPIVTGIDGRRAVAVVNGIYESSLTGKEIALRD
jgi:predicted dehydrogenase